jgi:RHS repeat-associated protein
VSGSQAAQNPFRFSTKFADDESGLVYYGYRYYNPSMGRWISRDPLEETIVEHLYQFSLNRPTTHIDVVGLYPADGQRIRPEDLINLLSALGQQQKPTPTPQPPLGQYPPVGMCNIVLFLGHNYDVADAAEEWYDNPKNRKCTAIDGIACGSPGYMDGRNKSRKTRNLPPLPLFWNNAPNVAVTRPGGEKEQGDEQGQARTMGQLQRELWNAAEEHASEKLCKGCCTRVRITFVDLQPKIPGMAHSGYNPVVIRVIMYECKGGNKRTLYDHEESTHGNNGR